VEKTRKKTVSNFSQDLLGPLAGEVSSEWQKYAYDRIGGSGKGSTASNKIKRRKKLGRGIPILGQ